MQGLIKNKLTISLDYFNKVTDNILQRREDVPALYGAGFPFLQYCQSKKHRL